MKVQKKKKKKVVRRNDTPPIVRPPPVAPPALLPPPPPPLMVKSNVLSIEKLNDLVGEIKDSIEQTTILLEKYQHVNTVSYEKVNVPDPTIISEEYGATILNDAYICSQVLLEKHDQLSTIEEFGVLFKWWKTIKRAIDLASIFRELRKRREKTGKKKRKTVKIMYDMELEKFNQKNLEYTSAVRYAKLGEFLLLYPLLTKQTVVTSMDKWVRNINFNGKKEKLIYIVKIN